MSGIAIYVEGGGTSAHGKAALRQGMDGFLNALKEQARTVNWRWRVVACGGRDQARDAFLNARRSNVGTVAILLVDSEGPVVGSTVDHLRNQDGWNLDGVEPGYVHLMVQIMETWLVADPDTLSSYYGQGFRQGVLPGALDLESVAKVDIEHAFQRATQGTQKGRYHKIRHAPDLLQRLSSDRVRQRCPHCQRLFDALGTTLQ